MKKLLLKNLLLVQDETITAVDIGINNQKIIDLGTINEIDYQEIIDFKQRSYVSSGWIDMHTHCYENIDFYKDDPDLIGYKTGVCSVVDAGSSGGDNVADFYELTKKKITNVYAFLNISKTGLTTHSELADLNNIDINLIKENCNKFKEFIVGLKVRMSKTVVGDNDIEPLLKALKIKKDVNLPLMIHIGSNPPKIEEVLNNLGEKDILTHAFNGKKNGIIKGKKVRKELIEAKKRGLILDVGHGKDSFNFEVAKICYEANIKADIISSDIYEYNRINGPVYDLATTMNKLFNIGYSLNEVINAVTINPSNILKLKNKAIVEMENDANLTIFKVSDDVSGLVDSNGNQIAADRVIKPEAVVINGEFIKIENNG